jgi:hypothetical protein
VSRDDATGGSAPGGRLSAIAAALVLAFLAAACGGGDDGGGGTASATAPAEEAFTRGPYLTRVGTTSARLRWIAARPGAAVTVSAIPAGGGGAAEASGPGRGGATLSRLDADTRYEWTAAVDGRVAATGAFTTAPEDLARGVDLIVFADYGAPNDASRAVARLAAGQDARLMITGGDNTYLVTLPQLLDVNLFRPLRDALAGAPNYGTVGDHDIPFPAGQRALAEALEWPNLGERYDLRYGPVQVVALGLRADAADVAFARRALARPGPLARFVVTHQPMKAGNPLLPVIAAAPVTAVLAGHLHAYERREVAGAPGVPFYTVGTGGAPRNDSRTPRSPEAVAHLLEFGLMRVRLEGDRAAYAFIDLDGRVRDEHVAPLTP